METKFDFTKTEDYLTKFIPLPVLKEYMYRLALNYGMEVDEDNAKEVKDDLYSIAAIIDLLNTIKTVS